MEDERLLEVINAYETMISENREEITELSQTVAELRREIKSSLVRVISSCNSAVKHVETTVAAYKAGKPDGYDLLVQTVADLKNVQNKTLLPFIANLAVANFSQDSIDNLSDKVDMLAAGLEEKTSVPGDLQITNVGIISGSDGTLLASKVQQGISLITLVFSDNGSKGLQGWWSQRDSTGSGILTDGDGNAYLLVQEGDNVKIKLLEESKEQETSLITADELAAVKDIASSGVTAEQLQSMISDIRRLKTESLKTLPVISVGAVTAEGGAATILEKTDDGLNVIKVTIGGVTLAGPWIKENTYGYGLLTDPESNVWNVHLDGLNVRAQNMGTAGELVGSNMVSADLEELLKTISEISNLAQLMVEPDGRISNLEKQVQNLADLISPVTDNVSANFAKLSDFGNLVNAVGTTGTVDGKNLLQMILDLRAEVNLLKNSSVSADTVISDPAVFNYKGEAVSPQHEIFLKLVRNMAEKGSRDITGTTLILQGLVGLTTRDLAVWIDDFVTNALWCEDINVFLNSFGVDLNNFDTGSILGYDTGSGVTYKITDIVSADYEQQLVYPATTYTFSDDNLLGGTYSMRLTKRNGLDTLVQMPDQISSSQRETVKKAVAWYIPASLDLVEKATSLSFNSLSSKLSKVKLLGNRDGFVTFEKKAIVLVFDAWDAAVGVVEPKEGDTITVNFTVTDSDAQKAAAVVLDINGNYYSQISGNNGIGINSAPQTFDRAVCHAIATAVFSCNISNYDTLPFWFKEGMSALVYGFDDKVTDDVKELLRSRTRLEKAFSSVPDDYDSWENSKDPTITGYLFLRYLISSLSVKDKETVSYDGLTEGTRITKTMLQNMAVSKQRNSAVILDEGIMSVTDKFKTASDIKNNFLLALEKSQDDGEELSAFLKRECNLISYTDGEGNVKGYDFAGTWPYDIKNRVISENTGYPTNVIHLDGQPVHFKYVGGTLFMFPDITTLTEHEQQTLGVIANCYIPAAVDIIRESTGFSFNRKLKVGIIKGTDGTVKTYNTPFIFITFNKDRISPYSLDDDDLAKVNCHVGDDGSVDTVNLTISSKYYGRIVDDITEGTSYDYPDKKPLGTLVLQELIKAALTVNLAGNRYPLWFTAGLAAAVSNDDLFNEMSAVLSDISRTETALDPDIQDFDSFADRADPAVAGFLLLHYFAKHI